MSTSSRASLSLVVGGRCNLTCTVCDCRRTPAERDEVGLPKLVRGGGERLVLRGESALEPGFERLVREAVTQGWRAVVVRTNGIVVHEPSVARRWRDLGVTGVLVPLFSHTSAVHDRVAGRPGALVSALRAMRACAEVGLAVHVEVPLLPPRLQQVGEVLRMAARAVPSLGSVRLFVPEQAQPAVLAAPSWDELGPALTGAREAIEELGLRCDIQSGDGIPLCALGHDERWQTRYRFNPKKAEHTPAGYQHPEPCARCVARRFCSGVPAQYAKQHGGAGLVPFTRRPKLLFSQRTTAPRGWSDAQRAAARAAEILVLRPTVNCNQDCYFCSANETSAEVHEDPQRMLRRIARAARSGVTWLSFSGGEPLLSKYLTDYLHAATRLGIAHRELVTNAVLLDNPERLRRVLDAGLTRVFVSLHAHDEALSQHLTAKVGDWERTVRAVDAMVEAGVDVTLNHVITGRNYWYIPRFAALVVQRWGTRVRVSFAFVTPQYRALEDPNMVPRLSDVMPYLHRALWTLVQAQVIFIVGSRQGVPPCLLGPYEGFSDVVRLAPNAVSEDGPQKVRAPGCDQCRYSAVCLGLWRSYVARHGLGELRPIVVEPEERDAQIEALSQMTVTYSFEQVPEFARQRALEVPYAQALEEPPVRRMLPLYRGEGPAPAASSAQPLVILGSGNRARVLVQALGRAPQLALAALASPHLLERDEALFAPYARYREAREALAEHPGAAVLVAALTQAHAPLTREALDAGRFVLLEKAPARSVDEALALARAPGAEQRVMMAHNLLFAAGLAALRQARAAGEMGEVRRVHVRRAMPARLAEAPRSWSRTVLFETLYHLVYLSAEGSGRCEAAVLSVRAQGDGAPEHLECTLRAGHVEVRLELDLRASVDELSLELDDGAGRKLQWRRAGPAETLVRTGAIGGRELSVQGGSELGRMLEAFAGFARGGARPALCAVDDGVAVMRTVGAVLDALGERVNRPEAPRHATSPALRSV